MSHTRSGVRLRHVLPLWALLTAGCPAGAPLQVPPSEGARPGPPLRDDSTAAAGQGGVVADAGPGSILITGDGGSLAHGPATRLAVGQPCFDGGECLSGVCEGDGCGVDQPGHCVQATRACHGLEQDFCSCGGESFRAPADCPGQPYSHRGPCGPAVGTPAAGTSGATPAP